VRYEERGQGYRDVEKVGKHCSTACILYSMRQQTIESRQRTKVRTHHNTY